jgi:hypothetical protein
MSKASRIATNKLAELSRIESDLRMLIDNPDDAGLDADDELHITQAIDHVGLATAELIKLTEG